VLIWKKKTKPVSRTQERLTLSLSLGNEKIRVALKIAAQGREDRGWEGMPSRDIPKKRRDEPSILGTGAHLPLEEEAKESNKAPGAYPEGNVPTSQVQRVDRSGNGKEGEKAPPGWSEISLGGKISLSMNQGILGAIIQAKVVQRESAISKGSRVTRAGEKEK